MKVIGLAGEAGCGKSAVGKILAKRPGVTSIDLDQLAWETYQSHSLTYDQLISRFGKAILSVRGEIDRSKLARIVFSHKESLADLNAIVHPALSRQAVRHARNVCAPPVAFITYSDILHRQTRRIRSTSMLKGASNRQRSKCSERSTTFLKAGKDGIQIINKAGECLFLRSHTHSVTCQILIELMPEIRQCVRYVCSKR